MKIKDKNNVSILMIVVISAIFGFIYETIFYRFDMGYFVKRGAGIGPWLPIYGIGGLLITLFTTKIKNKPFLIFIISSLVCGLLEFITGYILYNFFSIRLWDYNIEILNFGNIGGYICLRSVLFFGLSGLLLIKIVTPIIIKLYKFKPKQFSIISNVLFIIFLLDISINYVILNLIK